MHISTNLAAQSFNPHFVSIESVCSFYLSEGETDGMSQSSKKKNSVFKFSSGEVPKQKTRPDTWWGGVWGGKKRRADSLSPENVPLHHFSPHTVRVSI